MNSNAEILLNLSIGQVILHNEKQVGFPITSLREVRLLKRLSHVNCVSLLGVACGKGRDHVFLVFEYCEHDLASLCEQMGKKFSESEVKGLMVQLLCAVVSPILSLIHNTLQNLQLLFLPLFKTPTLKLRIIFMTTGLFIVTSRCRISCIIRAGN